jgi:hypothetical protein
MLTLTPKGNALPVLRLQPDATAALFRTARLSNDAFLAGSFQQSSRNSFYSSIYHLFYHYTLSIPQRNTNKTDILTETCLLDFLLCANLSVHVNT